MQEDYVNALCLEIETLFKSFKKNNKVKTIYIGGGTPSHLKTFYIEKILSSLAKWACLDNNCEISMEANPGSIDLCYLKEIRRAGINRLSIGMQSNNVQDLQILGRSHTTTDVSHAFSNARLAGFENINLDLIYGIPLQTLKMWKDSLTKIIEFHPEHISLYALTIEEGTQIKEKIRNQQLPELDDDLAADMFEMAEEFLQHFNYTHYEISNWAYKDGSHGLFMCQHNLQYWRNLPYLGFGAGAHGYIDNIRTVNENLPHRYIERCIYGGVFKFPQTPATNKMIEIDKDTEVKETMMMGLRLIDEGISEKNFLQRFGCTIKHFYEKEIDELLAKGLLEWVNGDNPSLRLTKRGRYLGNQVFLNFV